MQQVAFAVKHTYIMTPPASDSDSDSACTATPTTLILGHGAYYVERKMDARCSPIPITDWPAVYISVDYDKEIKPSVVHDLRKLPWPFESGSFHTILDTCGLGLYRRYNPRIDPSFFREVQRVLTPEGVFHGRGGFKFVSGTLIKEYESWADILASQLLAEQVIKLGA